jgi:hypothetical protein
MASSNPNVIVHDCITFTQTRRASTLEYLNRMLWDFFQADNEASAETSPNTLPMIIISEYVDTELVDKPGDQHAFNSQATDDQIAAPRQSDMPTYLGQLLHEAMNPTADHDPGKEWADIDDRHKNALIEVPTDIAESILMGEGVLDEAIEQEDYLDQASIGLSESEKHSEDKA